MTRARRPRRPIHAADPLLAFLNREEAIFRLLRPSLRATTGA